MPEETLTIEEVNALIQEAIKSHIHDGVLASQVNGFDIFGNVPSQLNELSATIATTGNTDIYIIAPISGKLESIDFSGVTALATNDTNYITFTITNLGRAGAGTTAMLGAVTGNTTKATGGTAIGANTVRELIISTALNASEVVAGDRLLIRAGVTGTLANTVTFPTYLLRFN